MLDPQPGQFFQEAGAAQRPDQPAVSIRIFANMPLRIHEDFPMQIHRGEHALLDKVHAFLWQAEEVVITEKGNRWVMRGCAGQDSPG